MPPLKGHELVKEQPVGEYLIRLYASARETDRRWWWTAS